MNIEELFNDFDLFAEASKEQLTGMLQIISDGKVPSRESVSQLDLSIANLRVKYESVVKEASSQLSKDEMPVENASALEYVEAIKNSKSLHLKRQIEVAKECLQSFIRVRSLVTAYTDALSPIQAQASELLKTLNSGKDIELAQVEESTVGPQILLAAIQCPDKDSDEGIMLCDKVAVLFPGRIHSGVVADKYFIDNSISTDDKDDSLKPIETSKSKAEQDLMKNDTNADNTVPIEVPANSISEASQNVADTTEDGNSNDSISGEATSFIQKLTTEKIFDIASEIGTMDVNQSQNESKKVTSKEFRNEMKYGDVAAEKIIIKAIDSRNNVTLDYLTKIKGVPTAVAESALLYMLKKGYLRKYSITPGGEFFCASSRLQTALSYMDVCRFADIKQRPISAWGETIEDKASSVASRVSLSRLYVDVVERLTAKGIKSYTETICSSTDSFCGKIFNASNSAECEIIAGAFWDNSEECGAFFDVFTDIISNCDEITRILFAAWNLDYSKKVIEILLSMQGDKQVSSPIYLYILSEDKFYSYPELKLITMEDMDDSDEGNGADQEGCNEIPDAFSEKTADKNEKESIADDNKSDDAEEKDSSVIDNQPEPNAASIESGVINPLNTDDGNNTMEKEEASASADDIEGIIADDSNAATTAADEVVDPILRLANSPLPPTDKELTAIISDILNEKAGNVLSENSYIAQALLLGKAASFSTANVNCKALYRQLSLATKSPLEDIPYTSENLSNILIDATSEAIILSSYLFGLLVPGAAYDYALKGQAEEYLRSFEDYFPSLQAVKPLFAKLNGLRDIVPVGFTEAILARLGSDTESEKYIKSIQAQAGNLLFVSTPKTRMKALPLLYNACFGKGSDLYTCLETVSNNDIAGADLINLVLADYCDEQEGIFTINNDKVAQKLDSEWNKVNGAGSSFQLEYAARQQALRQMNNRLIVIKAWVEHISVIPGGKYDFARLRKLRDEIIGLANKAQKDIVKNTIEYRTVIEWALKTISNYLSTPLSAASTLFTELAYTGIISLDDKFQPILLEDLDSVKYYEPWRTVLRHILSSVKGFNEAKKEILDGGEESDLFDNLHQLEVIGNLIGEDLKSTEDQIADAQNTARGNSKEFDDALELAYTYNRISETEKENLAAIKRQHEEAFFERKDFGIWRQFLKALKRRIDELTNSGKRDLQRRLDARFATENGKNSPILSAAQRLLNEDLNFAVTEEYINRFDSGEEDFSEELQSVLKETDHFSDFISDEVFKPIYNECDRLKANNFHNVARDYISRHFPSDWTVRLKEDSLRFVGKEPKNDKYWPIRKDNTTPNQITALFNWLGMNVSRAEKVGGKSEEMFKIDVCASPRSMADYRHPISLFGTQAKSQMNVIVLHGNIPAKQLVDKITGLGLGDMSIVVINYPINLAVRRQIAEEFHKTTGQNPFILIDQTLVIYLALHQITERLPIMLQCSLPYSTYQPFVRDGGSTADEMFFGRSKELATIKDPNGACVVYGGRQLGKTALLERAESLCFKPENRAYAVYCNILNCTTEESMVRKITEDVQKKTGLKLQNSNTIKSLCNEFEIMFHSKKIESLLLLLDETDKFLGSIAEQDYAQLQPLIDLKRSTKNSFKFVLAGLHNVCRAKNATARNGVFGQLGTPLCVKPLSPTDALQLLSRPLRYLGFQIDRYPHLETILTNTNYYPGILQFFGYMLVETLSTHYGKYYRAVDGNPPYTLQDDQLGAVMNSADLNRSIRDKFRWSLELDQRYFMIARCIAVLYYLSEESTNTWLGFSIEDIIGIATDYRINCLKNESENDYKNLLDEMVEMGILSKPNTDKDLYRLRRSSFINIIGSDFEAVDTDIVKNNTEVE